MISFWDGIRLIYLMSYHACIFPFVIHLKNHGSIGNYRPEVHFWLTEANILRNVCWREKIANNPIVAKYSISPGLFSETRFAFVAHTPFVGKHSGLCLQNSCSAKTWTIHVPGAESWEMGSYWSDNKLIHFISLYPEDTKGRIVRKPFKRKQFLGGDKKIIKWRQIEKQNVSKSTMKRFFITCRLLEPTGCLERIVLWEPRVSLYDRQ